MLRQHHVHLGLPVELPSVSQAVGMLISGMEASQHVAPVAAYGGTKTKVAVPVEAAHKAWLPSHTYMPGVIVPPEGIPADLAAGFALAPLQVARGKELPGVVVSPFMLPLHCGLQAVAVEQSRAKTDAVGIGLCLDGQAEHQ